MDADRFDALARSLTRTASSRRRLLTGVAGSSLGALAVALGFSDAGATHYGCRHVGQPCTRPRQCCSGSCRGPTGKQTCRAHHVGTCTPAKDICLNGGDPACGSGGGCFCYQTTGGASFCSSGAGRCMPCTKDAQCDRALNTVGAACVDANHGICTCVDFTTSCVEPCGSSSPAVATAGAVGAPPAPSPG